MKQVLAFILGTVFGMIVLLGAVAGIVYYAGWVLTPEDVTNYTKVDTSFFGDFQTLSIADMVKKIGELYQDKAGKLLSDEPDEDGHYYTIGEFFADNNVSLESAFGFTLPQSVKDIPVFEFFAGSVNGETGVHRALKQIKLSTVPDIVSLFTHNQVVSEATLQKLSDDSLYDLLIDQDCGITGVLEDITLAELLPDVFPTDADDTTTIAKLSTTEGEGTTQTVDQMRTLMVALGKTRIGAAIKAFTGGGNILLELKQGCPDDCTTEHEHLKDGALVELGKIEFTALVGNDATISAILGGKTISDILSDEGNITVDPILEDLYVGKILNLKQDESGNWVNADGTPADHIYTVIAGLTVKQLMDEKLDALNDLTIGTIIGLVNNQVADTAAYTDVVATKDINGTTYTVKKSSSDKYIISVLTCNEQHTHTDDCFAWFEAALNCNDTGSEHTHGYDCYGFAWYSKCENAEHTDDAAHTAAGCIKIDGSFCKTADGIYGIFANVSIGDLVNDGVDGIIEDVKNVKIGDLVGRDSLSGIMANFADLTVNELMSGTAFDTMYLGQILGNVRNELDVSTLGIDVVDGIKANGTGYAKQDGDKWFEAALKCNDDTHTHTAACYGFVWYVECAEGCAHDDSEHTKIDGKNHVKADALYNTLGSLTIGELTSGSTDKLMDSMMDLTIEDIVGEGKVNGAMANIAHMTIRELISDDGLNNIYLGTFLGNVRNELDDSGYTAVGELADVKENAGSYIRSDDGKWYKAKFSCNDTSSEHTHTAACYGFVWYVECAEGCTHTTDEHIIFDGKNHVKADALYNTLGSLTIGDLTNGSTDKLMDSMMDLTIEDIVGEGKVNGAMANIAHMTIRELISDDGLNNIYLGTFLGNVRDELDVTGYGDLATPIDGIKTNGTAFAKQDGDKWFVATFNCNDTSSEHAHTAACYGFVWYVECAEGCTHDDSEHTPFDGKNHVKADALYNTLGSLTIGELTSGSTDKLMDTVKTLTLKELAGDDLSGVMEALSDKTIGELMDGAIDDLYIGQLLQLERKEVAESTPNAIKDGEIWYEGKLVCDNTTHEHTADCYEFVWYSKCKVDCGHTETEHFALDGKDGKYTVATGVTAKLANQTVGGLDNLDDLINDLTLVDVMGDGVPEMLKSIENTKIGDLSTAIDNMYLGEFLKYHRNEVTNTDSYATVGTLADVKENAGSYIRKDGEIWYAAKFDCDTTHEHTADCYAYIWYTDDACTTEATGVTGKLANQKVSELNELDDLIDDLTLAEVMGEDGVPEMLKSIKDTKIGDLSTAIEGLYVGEAMSYVRNELDEMTLGSNVVEGVKENGSGYAKLVGGKWYEAKLDCTDSTHATHNAACYKQVWYVKCADTCTHDDSEHTTLTIDGVAAYYTVATGVTGKLANKKVSELNELDDLIDDLTLAEVMGEDKVPDMLKSIKDTKIGELNTAIEGLYVGEAMSYVRNELDEMTLGIEVADGIKVNGSGYAKLVGGNWYEAKLDCTNSTHTTHTADCYKQVWYVKCADGCTHDSSEHIELTIDGVAAYYTVATGVTGKLADTQISKLDSIDEQIEGFTLKDVLGDKVPDMLKDIENQPIGELETAIDGMYLGSFFGNVRNSDDAAGYTSVIDGSVTENGDKLYKLDGDKWYEATLNCADTTHGDTHTAACYEFVWYVKCADGCTHDSSEHIELTIDGVAAYYTVAAGVTGKLSSMKVSEMNTIESKIQSFTLNELLGDSVPDMLKSIGDTKLSEIDTAINGMRLGEMLGYKRNVANDTTPNKIQDGDTWYEGELVCTDTTHTTHTADCYDFVWYVECAEGCGHDSSEHTVIDGKNHVKADGMMATLASLEISELKDNDAIQSKIERMKLGDVMTIGADSPRILQKLKDSTLSSLGDDMNELALADVIEITDESPYLLKNLQGTKLDDLGTSMNGLTIADVVDVNAEGTSPIVKELANYKVDEIGDAINKLYVGTAMGNYRKSVDDVSGYTTNIATHVKSDGTNVAKSDDDTSWYEARIDCTDSTHATHTDDCYAYVWYTDDACTTEVSGVTAAFVNSKIDNMNATVDTLTLSKLGIVDDSSSNLLKAVKDTQLNNLGTEINNVKMGVMFGYEQVGGTWYVKCDGCEHSGSEHTTLTGLEGYYTEAKGLYAKLSDKTVKDLSDGSTLSTVVKEMTIGDFVDSGMLTIAEENQANLDVMIGCTHKFTETINVSITGYSTTKDMEYTCNLSGYIQWKLETSATDKSAKAFFNKTTHTNCTGKWRNMTLDQFLDAIFGVLNATN